MSRPMPDHGTRARYLRGCRCKPCTIDHTRYCKRHKYRTLVHGPMRTSVEPALFHLQQLTAAGWSWEQIAQAADCSRRSIGKILHGEQKTISPEHNEKILAVDPAALRGTRTALLPAVGFLRRGRALVAIGHNNQSIADALGMYSAAVSRLLCHDAPTIKAESWFAMADLYERWSTTPGTSKRARTIAADRGWHGPDAWDDIDDPDEKPGTELHLTATQQAAERLADIRLLASAGAQPEEIAARVGVTKDYVRTRLREQFPHLFLELTA